jgi:hypothetical protein
VLSARCKGHYQEVSGEVRCWVHVSQLFIQCCSTASQIRPCLTYRVDRSCTCARAAKTQLSSPPLTSTATLLPFEGSLISSEFESQQPACNGRWIHRQFIQGQEKAWRLVAQEGVCADSVRHEWAQIQMTEHQ